jgi:hypothetical protein
MQSPPARAIPDYFFKDHKPSAMERKARLRGLYRIIYSKDHNFGLHSTGSVVNV